ncbi:MAG: magnesium transporter [Bacillota bacterium]|nr:magnesium transporter [Bacillota bacterium]NLH87197.1 magnesium transporter [Bacillota bacterium]
MHETHTHVTEQIKSLLATGTEEALIDFVDTLHPADIVDLLEELDEAERSTFFHAIPADVAADIVEELEPIDQAELIRLMGAERSSEILREMDSDDAADLIAELPAAKAETLLDLMDIHGEDVRELLQYDEHSSGGIMATEYVSVHSEWTVEQTLSELRRVAPEAETVYYIYVLDDDEQLVGVLSFRDLVVAALDTRIDAIMNTNVLSVPVEADQEDVAQLFKKYRFLALPVVDKENKLTGIITADDILDVFEEEATEDIQKIAGTTPLEHPYFSSSIKELWSSRIVWLLVLFLAASLSGGIMQKFSTAMQTMIELTFFVPLLIDCGGNAGSQASTVVIRGLAVRDIRLRDIWAVMARELVVGLGLGAVMAGIGFLRAWRVGGSSAIGIVVSLAVLAIVVFSTVLGAILPIVATALRVDPAVMSAPLITTIVDAVGLLIYFSIAQLVLQV